MRVVDVKSKLKGKEYRIIMELRTRVTVVSDLSGSGKTLVRKLLMKETEDTYGFDHSDIKNIQTMLVGEPKRLNLKSKLIIIDNAEKLLKEVPELIGCINHDLDNYYIVFLRKSSIPIEVTPNSLAKLAFDETENTLYIKYVYKAGIWA